jgi:hypothetical protein
LVKSLSGFSHEVPTECGLHRTIDIYVELIRSKREDELILFSLLTDQVDRRDGIKQSGFDANEPDQRNALPTRSAESLIFCGSPLIAAQLVTMKPVRTLAVLVRQDAALSY